MHPGIHRNMDIPKAVRKSRDTRHFGLRKGRKSKQLADSFFPGPLETAGRRGLQQSRVLLGLSLSATLHSCVLR